MKTKLPFGVSVLIALVLVAFGLLYGTYSGYREDRAQVTSLLESENGLMDVLSYRGADGMNLRVVALRHLDAGDEDVLNMQNAAAVLQSSTAAIGERAAADKALEEAVLAVSAKLQQAPSFRHSERDQKYLDMLTADLNSLSASTTVSAYNQAAADFNAQLASPLVGDLAKLLGVTECPLFE